ncbi:NHL repeat protein [Leptospira wolbachii serovar Codice str. CDC]|uniref:NHL repeat protein n=1 Tax=Leptospira wolbachii serovar Codice str. CDC TaxID=1218599 RepID=R9A3K8_9LEPT|nr:NHL repeat-containing protein [Leptospira wolbachii]EOQ96609.1 NHL repeat protein [Leptospira wolbachii serovar Codice str. CDC]
MASLSNPCDADSKDFFPQLIVSANIEGGFCQFQVVNTGDLYRFTDFTFYKSIPISVLSRLGSKTEVSIRPNLPEGLYIDPNTGALSGTPTSPIDRQSYTVLRKGVALGQITIQVRDLVATKVYGQLGNLNCGLPYLTASDCSAGGPATAENLSGPNAVIADNAGGVYISSGNRVLYYPQGQTAAMRVYGQHGSFTCDISNAHTNQSCTPLGSIAATTLNNPRGIFLDASNNLFVADTGANRRLLVYADQSTVPFRAIGVPNFVTPGGGATSQSSFYTPIGLSLESSGGFYVSDSGDSRVIYFPKDANLPSAVYGQPDFVSNGSTQSANGLNANQGVVADSEGGIYVADTLNHRVVYFPRGSNTATRVYGQINFTTNTSSTSSNGLNNPVAVALDQSENLFVADLNGHRVLIYPRTNLTSGMTATGVVGQFGNLSCGADNNSGSCSPGSPTAQNLYRPTAIHFDKQGRLYIADYGNNRVLVY